MSMYSPHHQPDGLASSSAIRATNASSVLHAASRIPFVAEIANTAAICALVSISINVRLQWIFPWVLMDGLVTIARLSDVIVIQIMHLRIEPALISGTPISRCKPTSATNGQRTINA